MFKTSIATHVKTDHDGDHLTVGHGKLAVTRPFTVVFFQDMPDLTLSNSLQNSSTKQNIFTKFESSLDKDFVCIYFNFNDLELQNSYLFCKYFFIPHIELTLEYRVGIS